MSFTLFLILTLACEERIDLPSSSENVNLIVVEGLLTNENTNHLVKLTRSYMDQNGTPLPVTGAEVHIIEESNVYALTEYPAGSGKYYTPVVRALSGKIYTLYIQYSGREYFAHDSSVPVEPLPPMQFQKVNDRYALTLNPSGQEANYIDHIITWKHTAACTPLSACEGRIIFYDLKSSDVNDIFKPDKEQFTFPLNSSIIRKKYAVSAAYKNFLRSMLSETEWRGSVFDVERADVPTNLSNGAIGFFAVSTVVSDTTIVAE